MAKVFKRTISAQLSCLPYTLTISVFWEQSKEEKVKQRLLERYITHYKCPHLSFKVKQRLLKRYIIHYECPHLSFYHLKICKYKKSSLLNCSVLGFKTSRSISYYFCLTSYHTPLNVYRSAIKLFCWVKCSGSKAVPEAY